LFAKGFYCPKRHPNTPTNVKTAPLETEKRAVDNEIINVNKADPRLTNNEKSPENEVDDQRPSLNERMIELTNKISYTRGKIAILKDKPHTSTEMETLKKEVSMYQKELEKLRSEIQSVLDSIKSIKESFNEGMAKLAESLEDFMSPWDTSRGNFVHNNNLFEINDNKVFKNKEEATEDDLLEVLKDIPLLHLENALLGEFPLESLQTHNIPDVLVTLKFNNNEINVQRKHLAMYATILIDIHTNEIIIPLECSNEVGRFLLSIFETGYVKDITLPSLDDLNDFVKIQNYLGIKIGE